MTPKHLCGWVNRPDLYENFAAKQKHPHFMAAAQAIKGSGKGLDVFLWQCEEKVTGKDVRLPHNQTIGDCVSHGTGGACEDLEYIQILNNETNKQWKPVATEVIYAGARHEIGKDECGREDGAVIAWAIQWGLSYGIVPRDKYGHIDLTSYDGERARKWGMPRHGCPNMLEPIARKYPLLTATLIKGPDYYEQAIDALANQALIVTGSTQLFMKYRGTDGFILPDGPEGDDGHCTYYRGYTDNPKRPGIFYQNSWSENYHVGPQLVDIPGRNQQVKIPFGGGFIDAEVFNKMHQGQEVWAVSRMTNFSPMPAIAPVYHSSLTR